MPSLVKSRTTAADKAIPKYYNNACTMINATCQFYVSNLIMLSPKHQHLTMGHKICMLHVCCFAV